MERRSTPFALLIAFWACHLVASEEQPLRPGELALTPGKVIQFQLADTESGRITAAVVVEDPSPNHTLVKVAWQDHDGQPALRMDTNYDPGVGFYARVCEDGRPCFTSAFLVLPKIGGMRFALPEHTRSVVLRQFRIMRSTVPPHPAPLPRYKDWIPWMT